VAEIEILHAHLANGRIEKLEVRIKNADKREINREMALAWARDGHSMTPVAGHGHDVSHGAVLSLVEVGEELYLRTDTKAEASDVVDFPQH
jgi:hypothetical protein